MSNLETYESRLRQHISQLLALPTTGCSPQWARTLPTRSLEQWAQDVSQVTLDEAKQLLGADCAPSSAETTALPGINGDHQPGVYLGNLLSTVDVQDEWMYIGSATSPGQGLAHRTNKHQRKSHRNEVKKRGEGSFFYTLVDQKNKSRKLTFHKLCVAEFASGSPADVMYTRETCILAEQIYSGWMRSFGTKSRDVFKSFSTISPWTESTMGGANYTPPIKQPIKEADPDSVASTTPDELRAKKAAHKRNAAANETKEERAARLERNRIYSKEVTEPVKKMRAEGRSEEEIKAFRDGFEEKRKLTNPPPKSDGKGKRYKFDTATERTADDRIKEPKPRRNTQRKALAELPSNAPQA